MALTRRVIESLVFWKSMRGSWKGIAPLYPMTRVRELNHTIPSRVLQN
jgi:hypothetical protein